MILNYINMCHLENDWSSQSHLCDEQVDEAKRNWHDPGRVWESEVREPQSATCSQTCFWCGLMYRNIHVSILKAPYGWLQGSFAKFKQQQNMWNNWLMDVTHQGERVPFPGWDYARPETDKPTWAAGPRSANWTWMGGSYLEHKAQTRFVSDSSWNGTCGCNYSNNYVANKVVV